MKAVLFDVDGTLVKLRGAGRAALIAAIAELFGLEQERVQAEVARIDFRGATDRRIVGTLMELLQLDGDARVHHVFERYVLRLQQTVHERGGELLPGVDGLVRLLEQRADVIVGLLTGNIRPAARTKLSLFSLGYLADRPGGFGDDGLERVEIARVALARAARHRVEPHQVIVVGDTQHDVAAARAVGAVPVAVASGWTPAVELEAARAELFLHGLEDPAPLLGLIDQMDP